MLKLILFTLSLISSAAVAQAKFTGQDCNKGSQDTPDSTSVSLLKTQVQKCMVWTSPINKPEMIYRDFIFDERGIFTIFVSVTGDDDNKFTGKRAFMFFPRVQEPSYKIEGDKITVELASRKHVVLSAKTAGIISIEDATIEIAEKINLENNGGVEIKSYKGLYLDFGWELGHAAYFNPKRTSTFKDAHGKSCPVANTDLFKYGEFVEKNMYGEPEFKFEDNKQLIEYLEDTCPMLDISSLQKK